MISRSDPETVKVTVSPSTSVAVTVPIAVWFSAAVNEADEVNDEASLTSVTVTVTPWVVVFVPSEAVVNGHLK